MSDPDIDPDIWPSICLSAALVLIGGAFAGLTIAFMTQDDINLRVIASSGDAADRRNAQKVISLLDRGKHWILVTLLLGNCIASEALPVILDPILHGGLPAVLGSTVLIVIFSEIIPQSICARHSLTIGAYMVPCASLFMYILGPVSWPIGKLLDKLVGDSHATGYKRSQLKTLFSLHKSMGKSEDRLNQDEVKVVHGALGLVDKPVTSIMTPLGDVYSISADKVLNERTMHQIRVKGYSRILVHAPRNQMEFLGVLLTKQLIKYKPRSYRRVYDFDWTPIPVIHAKTTCLNMLKIFQEKKYQMVLVGQKEKGIMLGIVTKEDLIEELIGEEILDECDNQDLNEKIIIRQRKRTTTRAPVQSIIQKHQIIAVSAPEGELLPLWVKSNFSPNYGSLDYFNAASKWRYIQNYLPNSQKKSCQEIELGTTYGSTREVRV
ncbi:hypothetical protein N7493_004974 [Penicillium malachiteum]|uniref:CNNM transmembrane domain-containing protein n=1 Tax=Penicillium malachiteum TaxID=1324776 RepID=A0AAD6MW69_9EURO|nr:hypothetical protein N7493_004974 [Penicillium malachiteum]